MARISYVELVKEFETTPLIGKTDDEWAALGLEFLVYSAWDKCADCLDRAFAVSEKHKDAYQRMAQTCRKRSFGS